MRALFAAACPPVRLQVETFFQQHLQHEIDFRRIQGVGLTRRVTGNNIGRHLRLNLEPLLPDPIRQRSRDPRTDLPHGGRCCHDTGTGTATQIGPDDELEQFGSVDVSFASKEVSLVPA